jgi:hypothetical protein
MKVELMNTLSSLHHILNVVPERLAALLKDAVERKPSTTNWSPKEELGHLLDSAVNNHQRIVRAQMEDKLALPGYEQNRWVAIHRYHQREWAELIELWTTFNRQLLIAAEAVPDSAWSHTLSVGGGESVTLQFVFEDYIRHMLHHLEHIGIEVTDLGSTQYKATA